VNLRLLLLFLAVVAGVFGQDVFRPQAGDLAPEITFAKVLHTAAAKPWTAANLSGQVTVLFPAQQRSKGDFVQRLRDQMGLVIAPAQRYVETMVYRLR
jgi:hypothetical protein